MLLQSELKNCSVSKFFVEILKDPGKFCTIQEGLVTLRLQRPSLPILENVYYVFTCIHCRTGGWLSCDRYVYTLTIYVHSNKNNILWRVETELKQTLAVSF